MGGHGRDDDIESRAHHLLREVDDRCTLWPSEPSVPRRLGSGRHPRDEGADVVRTKYRCRGASLATPEGAIRRQQAAPEGRGQRPRHEPLAFEGGGLIHEQRSDQVGIDDEMRPLTQ